MDAKELELRQHHNAWICTLCSTLWFDSELAEKCCSQQPCTKCTKRAAGVGSICSFCREQDRLAVESLQFLAATKILYIDYDLPWIFWAGPHGHGGFFRTKKELEAYCLQNKMLLPKWVWACEPTAFLLDAEYVLAGARDSGNRPVRALIDDADVDVLQQRLDDWATNLDLRTYDVDYETAIILDRSLFDTPED